MCFFYDWLRSRSNPHLKFLHVLSWLGSSFLFSTEGFSIAWQCHRVEVQAPGMASTDTSGWAPSLTPLARSPPSSTATATPAAWSQLAEGDSPGSRPGLRRQGQERGTFTACSAQLAFVLRFLSC